MYTEYHTCINTAWIQDGSRVRFLRDFFSQCKADWFMVKLTAKPGVIDDQNILKPCFPVDQIPTSLLNK